MNMNSYQLAAARTLNNDLSLRDQQINCAMGLLGESAEISEHVKKWAFQGHEIDADKILIEAGDVLWYLAMVCQKYGISLGDVAATNLAKLRARYPEKFTEEASRERKEGADSRHAFDRRSAGPRSG